MTWRVTDRMTIYREEGFYALSPCVNRTPGGDLLMTFQRAPHVSLPNHKHPLFNVRQGFTGPHVTDPSFEDRLLVLVHSDDDGRTWSKWRPTMIHRSPGHMLGLRDGRIFLTVGTRWAGQRGYSARILDPEGENLDTAPEIIIRDDAISPDCGYPWSVELDDGRVLVTYWHHFEDDLRGIEGAILDEV